MDRSPGSAPDAPEPGRPAVGEPLPEPERDIASVVPIGRHEEVDGVCGRIDSAPTLAVVLHAPGGNHAMAEELGMRRVVRHVEASGRVFAIATRSGALARRARELRVPVASDPRKVHWRSGGKVVVRLGSAVLLLPPFGRYAPYAVLGLFVLAILAGLWTAGPSVTVTVYPRTETVSGLAVVRASPRVDAVDFESLTVPVTVVAINRDILLAVPATGSITVGVSSATVALVLTNTTDAPVPVPAGSVIFALPGSVAFMLDEAVTVPAGGDAVAAATARAAGAAGNVEAGTVTQWRSQKFTVLTATNPAPAAGGADETLRAIDPADILALEALAAEIAENNPPGALLVSARPRHAVIARSATATVTLGPPSATPGTPAGSVFMEARIVLEALAIPPGVLDALARTLLGAPEGFGVIVPGTVTAVETGALEQDHPDGSLTLELRVSAEFPEGPAAAVIADAVSGRSASAAESELRSRYGIDDVEIDLTPGWAPQLPRFGFRIDVEFASRAPDEAAASTASARPPDGS